MHSCVQTFLISIQWTVKFAPIHYLDTVRVDTINIFIVHFFPSIFLPVHFFPPPRCPFHLPPLPCLLNSSLIHFSSFPLHFPSPLPFSSLNLPSQSIRLLLPSFFTSSHTSSVFHHSSSFPILLPSSIILHPFPYFFRLPSFFIPSHTSSVFHHSSSLPILLPSSVILHPFPNFFRVHHSSAPPLLLPIPTSLYYCKK